MAAPHDNTPSTHDEDEDDGDGRVLTVPNLLSVIRLLCVPLFLWLLFGQDKRSQAAYLLGALGATDWVDGYIARHFNQVSKLGKILDPTADRILLLVGIAAILVDGAVPPAIAIAALARELAVAITALVIASMGARRIDVTWLGKAGTFALMFAFPLFLAGHAPEAELSWHETANTLAWIFAIPGLILSYYAAALYVPIARTALREGRVGSTT